MMFVILNVVIVIDIYVLLIGWCGIRWGVLLDRFVYDICPCCCIVDCSSWYSQVSVCRFVFLNNCCVRLWCVVVVTAICCAGICVFLKCWCWKCACVRCVLLCARVLDVESAALYEECSGLFVLLSFMLWMTNIDRLCSGRCNGSLLWVRCACCVRVYWGVGCCSIVLLRCSVLFGIWARVVVCWLIPLLLVVVAW